MARPILSAVRCMLMLLFALACQAARADTPMRLLKSYVGNVNFVGTQVTVRDKRNTKECHVFPPGQDRMATLSGIPEAAEILSAHLYWAGSNYNPDFNVTMDGAPVSAEDGRRYYSTTIGNGFNYYSGAADVTQQVRTKRNGNYLFRGLTVDKNAPYCSVEGVLGGFSLLVIYSHADQPFRMLNLYEGFQYIRYGGFTLNLSGFRVPDPIGAATGRIGHITWEGDASLGSFGENLKFNDYEMTDARNPSGNQFNSRSSINGDDASYGIDFDAYTLAAPVINSGDTTASTRYESGQDLVLLSAEVVALPNVPLSDLAISLDLEDKMISGRATPMTVVVSNKGPSTASGPTVVTSTLPNELSFEGGSGDGWTCSAIGQQVTCSHQGTLPAGQALPVLSISAKVAATGTIIASASVSGIMYDPQPANNAASDQGTAVAGGSRYVFTDKACVKDLKLGEGGQCTTQLSSSRAGEPRKLYITGVNGDDVPVLPVNPSEDMFFALRCINPTETAGVIPRVDTISLKPCANKDGALEDSPSSTKLSFNGYSAEIEFAYADVGKIVLSLRPAGSATVATSSEFVSIPYELKIVQVRNKDGDAVPAGLTDTDTFVLRAGEPFTVSVASLAFVNGAPGVVTPNFGNEDDGTKPELSVPLVSMVHGADPPALEGQPMMPTSGQATGTFTWQDAGVISLTPAITNNAYLNVPVTGMAATAAKAGRFIPHHFETTVVGLPGCLDRMVCPNDVETAAYSRQPFAVTITARSKSGAQTKNYDGIFARETKLSAAVSAGGAARAGLSDTSAAGTAFTDGVATVRPHFVLPNGFVHTAPQAPWGAPETIYLRAVDADSVTSLQGPGSSLEGGIRIVNGRLLVPNAHGSERLPLPLKVSAQYWTGANWELSSNDQQSEVDPAKAVFSNTGALALSIGPPGVEKLVSGVRNYSVKATPAAAGKADLVIDHLEWLPSTKGRLKFGIYKSPLIYLRELH